MKLGDGYMEVPLVLKMKKRKPGKHIKTHKVFYLITELPFMPKEFGLFIVIAFCIPLWAYRTIHSSQSSKLKLKLLLPLLLWPQLREPSSNFMKEPKRYSLSFARVSLSSIFSLWGEKLGVFLIPQVDWRIWLYSFVLSCPTHTKLLITVCWQILQWVLGNTKAICACLRHHKPNFICINSVKKS